MSIEVKTLFCNVCEVILDNTDKDFVDIYGKCPFCNEINFKVVSVFE